jgi:hypothetical protein
MACLRRNASLGKRRGCLNSLFCASTALKPCFVARSMATKSPVNSFVRPWTKTPVRLLMMMALALAGVLLFSDLPRLPNRLHAFLSSSPLAIAGVGYAILQLLTRPPLEKLLKRLLLAATFVLWAIDQLLPAGKVATFVSDIVIAAYVLDLYWLTQEQAPAKVSSG